MVSIGDSTVTFGSNRQMGEKEGPYHNARAEVVFPMPNASSVWRSGITPP